MSTTSTYIGIESNLASYQKLTADQPAVKTATQYYTQNIAKVTSVNQFVSNYRLLSYALQAYGLGNQVNNTALVKKILEQGTSSPKDLANTLSNTAWKTFANAFNFSATGSASPTSSGSVTTTENNYTEQQLETNEGESDPGVQLALYFKRVAPSVTSGYGLLADQNLLDVVQTTFNLSPSTSASAIDKEATEVEKLVPTSELQDPQKLQQLVERFTAAYDSDYGPASGNSSSLTVTNGNQAPTAPAAQSILAGVVSNNAYALSSVLPRSTFNVGLLAGLNGLSLGG